MEVDEPIPSMSTGGPMVPAPKTVMLKDYKLLNQVDEAGMRQWAHDMLSGNPGGRATAFE